MAHPTTIFGDLSTYFWQSIASGEYAQALNLIRMEGERFPEEAWHVCEWQVLAGALCGDVDYAIAMLDQGVGNGLWYPETHLRREGMEALQGIPAFERLVAICTERHAEATTVTTPALYISSPQSHPPHPLVLNVHRNHSNVERDRPYWMQIVEAGWALAMPQSSQVMGPGVHIWNDRALAMHELKAHYDALTANNGYDMGRTIWAGYMTGADIAMRLALSGEVAAVGFIAISPYIGDVDFYTPLLNAASAAQIRGYVFIGAQDTRCGPGTSTLVERMRSSGISVRLQVQPDFTFGYPTDFPDVLADAIEFVAD